MTSKPPTPSRLAGPVAQAIAGAFADYREGFLAVTGRAKHSFETRDWGRLREDSARRLGIYRDAVDRAEHEVRLLLRELLCDRLVWVSAKAVYSTLIGQRQDWDLAETFFNSVTRRLFDTVGVDPLIEYVASDFDAPPTEIVEKVYERYPVGESLSEVVERCLRDTRLVTPWAGLADDVSLTTERIEAHLAMHRGSPQALEVLRPTFFRGKGAYVVGRLVLSAGEVVPVVLALRNGPAGVFVDAVLVERDEVSILFSFTRSYFHVDVARPYDVMRFLRSLIPKKPVAELYIAIGEPKQGKTELYRALMETIDETRERFEHAPGTPGLVMVVFTMPSLDIVLKVIRKEFPPEKETTPEKVRAAYGWVYGHDRVGRLVDAQEFEHLVFPRERFEEDLLEELLRTCSDTVWTEGDRVVVDLAYIERKLVPLNVYVREAEPARARAAILEYAEAVEDLASCNIFPGDLLLKNFGVTRHGRVALYDYDELRELTEMRFRSMPAARFVEEEVSAEPFFAVGARDVFPEEFRRFIGMPPKVRAELTKRRPELFDPSWWRSIQARLREGKILEFAPYPPERRLRPGPREL